MVYCHSIDPCICLLCSHAMAIEAEDDSFNTWENFEMEKFTEFGEYKAVHKFNLPPTFF